MTKLQLIIVSASILFFCVLYFGLDTKPRKQALIEKSRALAAESTDITALLSEAKQKIQPADASKIIPLEQSLSETLSDSAKVALYQELSGIWFQVGKPEISGYYAEQVAAILGGEEAWSIAGTTYAIGQQRAEEEKIKTYCAGRAIKAFENAISINPSNTNHSLNLALCYVEAPPKDNPMKGIQMLLDLNKRFPDDANVLYNLGRLGNQTRQYEKAATRLEKALSLDPQNRKISCQLAESYTGLGKEGLAAEQNKKCQLLNIDN